MADFTGITADKANEILGMSVVSGAINGSGHLILARANGQTIDAGDFTAIVSGIMDDSVETEVAAQVPNAVAGSVVDFGDQHTEIGFGSLNPSTLVNVMIKVRLTGNIIINASDLPVSPKPNTQFAMRLQQDGSGSRTLTLINFKKSQGVLSLTPTPSAVDMLVFIYDGTEWFVGLMGVDLK